MRYIFIAIMTVMFLGGCSNTWHGVKEDTGDAVDWSKKKVNKGAGWVEEKTSN